MQSKNPLNLLGMQKQRHTAGQRSLVIYMERFCRAVWQDHACEYLGHGQQGTRMKTHIVFCRITAGAALGESKESEGESRVMWDEQWRGSIWVCEQRSLLLFASCSACSLIVRGWRWFTEQSGLCIWYFAVTFRKPGFQWGVVLGFFF